MNIFEELEKKSNWAEILANSPAEEPCVKLSDVKKEISLCREELKKRLRENYGYPWTQFEPTIDEVLGERK